LVQCVEEKRKINTPTFKKLTQDRTKNTKYAKKK